MINLRRNSSDLDGNRWPERAVLLFRGILAGTVLRAALVATIGTEAGRGPKMGCDDQREFDHMNLLRQRRLSARPKKNTKHSVEASGGTSTRH